MDVLNKLANNELVVLECEQIHLINLVRLEINRDMQINDMKINIREVAKTDQRLPRRFIPKNSRPSPPIPDSQIFIPPIMISIWVLTP